MLSNLPPGVTESMIPGNRLEDQELEFIIYLTVGQMDDLVDWMEKKSTPPTYILEDLYDQLEEEYKERSSRLYGD